MTEVKGASGLEDDEGGGDIEGLEDDEGVEDVKGIEGFVGVLEEENDGFIRGFESGAELSGRL